MKYLLLIYADEQAKSDKEREDCRNEAVKLAEDLRSKGQYLAANPDHRAGMATTESWWWRDLKTDPRYKEMVGSGT